MTPFFRALTAGFLFASAWCPARAGEDDAKAILDKARTALGGAENLAKIEAISWTSKLTFKLNGNESTVDSAVTIKGLDHVRREFGTNLVILAGEKGWRKRGGDIAELTAESVPIEKRNIYLQVIPITLAALDGKDFKYEAAGEEKVGDRPAAILKITAPDGKDFRLSFDKETGLPVKEVANLVTPQGNVLTAETTFADYKDFGGIKKATRVETTSNRGGSQVVELSEFKVLDKVAADTFAEPNS
jgi:hypothetical protein